MVDHDTGRMVWAGKDRTADTLRTFFDQRGADRAKALTHVSADGAEWIHDVGRERAGQAVICLDAVHVIAWATAALDAGRRGAGNQVRKTADTAAAQELTGTRWPC